jgi:hypothetical protein
MYIDEASLEASANWEVLFRKKHPMVSFMRDASDEFLARHGIFPVAPHARQVGVNYKVLQPQNADGRWFEVLEII